MLKKANNGQSIGACLLRCNISMLPRHSDRMLMTPSNAEAAWRKRRFSHRAFFFAPLFFSEKEEPSRWGLALYKERSDHNILDLMAELTAASTGIKVIFCCSN